MAVETALAFSVRCGGKVKQDSGPYALDKNDLYTGAPLSVAEADLGSSYFTVQPVKLHGYESGGWPAPGTPHHFISHNANRSSRIWRWSDPLSTAPVVYGTITENLFLGAPPNAPELGGTVNDLNDTGSGRWLDAEDLYRVMSLFGLGVTLMLLAWLYQRFVFRELRS